MPEGSSSVARVMKPGPTDLECVRREKVRRKRFLVSVALSDAYNWVASEINSSGLRRPRIIQRWAPRRHARAFLSGARAS